VFDGYNQDIKTSFLKKILCYLLSSTLYNSRPDILLVWVMESFIRKLLLPNEVLILNL